MRGWSGAGGGARSRPAAVVAACLLTAAAACTGGSRPAAAPERPATSPRPAATTTPGRPAVSPPSASSPAGDWPMYHRTADRAGVAPLMPPAAGTPRIVQDLRLDHAVYASPVVAAGTVVVATEGDVLYALDTAGRVRWQRRVGTPAAASELPCGNIDPLGVTGTPIVAAGVVYVAAEFGGPPRHELLAVDLATGALRWTRSIDLPGTQTAAMQQRGALAITGGRVWVPFGGLAGDCGGYRGRLVGVPLDGRGPTLAYTVPTRREAGAWAPPGPSVDAGGNLLQVVGNGAAGPGDAYDHSDAVLEISPDGRLTDFFAPTGWAAENAADQDLGSQGAALVGPWIFSAGKSGTAYVLRADHLGGIGGQVSKAALCVSFGGTAVDGSTVYVPCTDGLRAVRIDAAGTMHLLWHARSTITGSPVVGGGRVWSLDPSGGVLYGLDPRTGAVREQAAVGAASRFATPAAAGRDLLVPTLSGLVVLATS